ncbi:MAG: NUDIX hydrolase [Balneolaceae bacterium]|nr:NUDIX hydrolase [Balneolaceae bacterium]
MKIVPITAAGGVLFRQGAGETEVLLIFRRGVWDLPKGKLEGEESIVECAQREVSEEVGAPWPEVTAKLTKTYHEYEEDGRQIGKTTHWYAMQIPRDHELKPEGDEGITKLEWMPISAAIENVGFENLRDVLTVLEGHLQDRDV